MGRLLTFHPDFPFEFRHIALARDLRQLLENKGFYERCAVLTGEPDGDCQNGDLRVGFDGRLKLKFLGRQVATDAGLVAYRELDEARAF